MTTPDTENSDPLLMRTNRAETEKKNRRFAIVVFVACVFGITGCSTVPKDVRNQLNAECAHISSRSERVKCKVSKERNWERQQEIDAAITDCKRYWPEEKTMEIANCVDRKVNPVSKRDGAGNAAAALAICTALAGGNAASCAAGVGKSHDTRGNKKNERVRDLEQELERKQQKFSQDCLFSGGVAAGDTCLNSRK